MKDSSKVSTLEQSPKSLEALRECKSALRLKMNESEDKLSYIWNDTFHSPKKSNIVSPTHRAINLLTNSAGIIDGAIFGWKLYRKLGGSIKLFKKNKTKRK